MHIQETRATDKKQKVIFLFIVFAGLVLFSYFLLPKPYNLFYEDVYEKNTSIVAYIIPFLSLVIACISFYFYVKLQLHSSLIAKINKKEREMHQELNTQLNNLKKSSTKNKSMAIAEKINKILSELEDFYKEEPLKEIKTR